MAFLYKNGDYIGDKIVNLKSENGEYKNDVLWEGQKLLYNKDSSNVLILLFKSGKLYGIEDENLEISYNPQFR